MAIAWRNNRWESDDPVEQEILSRVTLPAPTEEPMADVQRYIDNVRRDNVIALTVPSVDTLTSLRERNEHETMVGAVRAHFSSLGMQHTEQQVEDFIRFVGPENIHVGPNHNITVDIDAFSRRSETAGNLVAQAIGLQVDRVRESLPDLFGGDLAFSNIIPPGNVRVNSNVAPQVRPSYFFITYQRNLIEVEEHYNNEGELSLTLYNSDFTNEVQQGLVAEIEAAPLPGMVHPPRMIDDVMHVWRSGGYATLPLSYGQTGLSDEERAFINARADYYHIQPRATVYSIHEINPSRFSVGDELDVTQLGRVRIVSMDSINFIINVVRVVDEAVRTLGEIAVDESVPAGLGGISVWPSSSGEWHGLNRSSYPGRLSVPTSRRDSPVSGPVAPSDMPEVARLRQKLKSETRKHVRRDLERQITQMTASLDKKERKELRKELADCKKTIEKMVEAYEAEKRQLYQQIHTQSHEINVIKTSLRELWAFARDGDEKTQGLSVSQLIGLIRMKIQLLKNPVQRVPDAQRRIKI